jgi:REP element-mobilizing transposase RayT
MTISPDIYHRRSIRLKNYDYYENGAYFITVCAQNGECLFGKIADSVMQVNDAGSMIESWWLELSHKFPVIDMDIYSVMPNHFYGIVAIVGAALSGRPNPDYSLPEWQPRRVAPTLGNIVNWFKTMTTNDYIQGVRHHQWRPFPGKLWQRNYYEHIIRGEADLDKIREYILYNPLRWADDEENPDMRQEQKSSS